MYEIVTDILSIDKYSFSKLSSIYQCPYSYNLYYKEGISGESNGFALCGSLVHSILERYFKNELLQFELVDTFLNEFNNDIPNGVKLVFENGFSRDLSNKYKEECVDFLSNFDSLDGLKVIGIEENFNLLVKILDKMFFLNGFVDIIAKDNEDNYYIIDWKSKSKFKNKEEVKTYSRQLYIYSLYCKYKFGKFPKELWFYQFRINHIEKITFNENDFNEALKWARDSIDKIENEKEWKPNPDSFYCNNLCNHRNICDYK